ncbi:hypothetical protein D5F01_LYC19064 [Larimichthys crocea]|uniref:Mitotic interactor and substrate of PLK1 n=1 Tax=Larimichthys crocea TaxID=215358 RepID=A0A6G0HXC4_LARCR|nr:hypothetical protein D5F01_LYC19064 [Larimichthys crocea]
METRHPRPSPQDLKDDGGLWMKTDSNHTDSPSAVAPPAPSLITRYYSMMDDEVAGDVFPPPPSYMAPPLPVECSADEMVNNPSVTLTNVPADATDAKTNPTNQLMAAHNKVDEVKTSTAKTSEEFMDTVALSKDEDSTLPKDQDQTSMEGRGGNLDNTTEDRESQAEPEVILSRRQKNWRETDVEKDRTHSEDICGLAESCGPSAPCKCIQNKPHVPEVPTEAPNDDDEEQADPRTSEETETEGEQGDGRRITTDIQQGEQLLQRLQNVQLRQDECTESPHASQQVNQEVRGRTTGALGTEVDHFKASEVNLTVGDEKEETVRDEGGKTMSPSIMPAEPEPITDQSDSRVSPINSSNQIPFPSIRRFSDTETSIERQINEAAQEQNLQRVGGLFNLADNPDVLEIPFKTNILLETLITSVGPGQYSDWQFSEQKMQKEISQEIQRELVLVNQGKIPGGYSKGEVRQIKETKLLFEAFQQDNTEGPTRYRKSPTSQMKGHIYPSVLERTQSLEMFSLKSRPVYRANSLRVYKTSEIEKSPEDLRSQTPTGGSGGGDKTHLLSCPKQDKRARLFRSMDSISNDTSSVEKREGNMAHESPILKQNPFYKLRPALALKPEVEKDIREAKAREEELRRQRCTLYGENRQNSEDGEKSRFKPTVVPDDRRLSRGKLERVWPPPSNVDQTKPEQTQEPKVHRTGSQKAPLWQRWESGLVNGQPSKENN